jgi:Mn2+/Fe2+ NRAMP family transporter
VHAAAGAWLVDKSRYSGFERALGAFVAIMVFAIVGTAAWSVFAGFTPWRGEILPRASDAQWCLGLIGGIGGSVTLLAHGYWMRSHGWSDFRFARAARIDLAVGYGVTALFGIASMLLAASIFAPHTILRGDGAPLQLAQMLKLRLGSVGVALYLVGMWATALAAWLGTLQSVPQLLGGFLDAREWKPRSLDTRGFQRACFVFLCVVPLPLVLVGEPVSLVVAFAILASFVLPGLSAGMLVLGGRRPPWGKLTTIALVAALALFCVLSVASLSR